MKLHELKKLLEENGEKQFLLQLPNQSTVPQCFHITEVGLVSKTFIDCGGQAHSTQTCQLQAWIGPDSDHRLEASKMASILKISSAVIPHDFLDVEIEYEDEIISQYPVDGVMVTDDAVTLLLTLKHTDCLAKDLCLAPAASGQGCGCGPTGCC